MIIGHTVSLNFFSRLAQTLKYFILSFLSKCNSRCEHVCHQVVMPSHDANNDTAEMMIKRGLLRTVYYCKISTARCRLCHFFSLGTICGGDRLL